ncbi:2-amino-4-hydroxy-6-hydroxymethyldihydropteridine diphosphokinase [Aeromonas sobria]|uniref:2-amino-4-hydroxy-6- hydroxymethyldihydropteridine diphosphokinase n=1 Tax=Aeromonas sobria TaxID=646 RepID=UPI003D032C4E
MFYLCSIGSNLEPERHVDRALGELLARFRRLQLSSVIKTKPVGMQSRHDFLNCLFVIESESAPQSLKAEFIAMEQAHGRNRGDPLCKVHDRPLDIDILAMGDDDDFHAAEVDAYLQDLLAELYGEQPANVQKVVLSPCGVTIGQAPVYLSQGSDDGQGAATVHLDARPRHVVIAQQ